MPAHGIILFILISLTSLPAAAERWVSVNQCTDRMMAYLAPEHLVSVTWLSHDGESLAVQPLLAARPANHARIEEILGYRPHGVIGGEYGAPGLGPLLARFDIPFHRLPQAQSPEENFAGWRQLGAWMDRSAEAEAIIQRIDAGLQQARNDLGGAATRVLWLNPGGWVAGSGMMQDSLLEALGLTNVAAEQGLLGWQRISLEVLLNWAPERVLVSRQDDQGFSHAVHWLAHPAIAALAEQGRYVAVDSSATDCLTPDLVPALQQLVTAWHTT